MIFNFQLVLVFVLVACYYGGRKRNGGRGYGNGILLSERFYLFAQRWASSFSFVPKRCRRHVALRRHCCHSCGRCR